MASFTPSFADIERFESYLIARYSPSMVAHARRVMFHYLLWITQEGMSVETPDSFSREMQKRFIAESEYCNARSADRPGSPLDNSIKRVANTILKKLGTFLVRGSLDDIEPGFKFPSKTAMRNRFKVISGKSVREEIATYVANEQTPSPMTSGSGLAIDDDPITLADTSFDWS